MSDLKIAFDVLRSKQTGYNTLWDYYDGDHPLIYSASRLRKVFRHLDATFVENWCAVVVDSALERIQLEQLMVAGDEGRGQELSTLFKATQLDMDADDVHLAALVIGEAFVIVWPEFTGDGEFGPLQAYYNDPRLCHVQYDAENPRRVNWAAKWWRDGDRYRMTLYYPDRLEYYVTNSTKEMVTAETAFAEADPPVAENPFGEVPVFHFMRERRKVKSEMKNVVSLQAAINKLLTDMMVSAEFGAFKQRYVISNADNLGALKNAPNEIWQIPGGDGAGQQSSVGELSATELGNFSGAIGDLVGAMSAISRTPHHYFFRQSGNVPSGEALIALEAPLNKKCARYIGRFANTWQRVGAFMLRVTTGQPVAPETVTPVFADPATVQPRTRAEIREIRVRAGEPLVTVLRDQGYPEAYIEQMRTDRRDEQAEAQRGLAQALLEQQRRFDQGA